MDAQHSAHKQECRELRYEQVCTLLENTYAGSVLDCRCIVTQSRYTKDENFESADAVYDCIGDAGEERFSLNDLTPPGVSEPAVVST